MDEKKAIERLKQGDISGLEALVRLHQARALRAAYLITHDYPLAEDVVQGAFLRAYERIAQFNDNRPFTPWFMRSVVNDALKASTRNGHLSLEGEAAGVAEMQASQEPGADALLERAETKEEIWAALERLSPGQRAAVVARYYLDLSDAEIASSLDLPPGTVRRRLHDARQRLRKLLPNYVK